jgi:hypothetical protein
MEAYFMHMRTLVEFFLQGGDSRDMHSRDYLPDWRPAKDSGAKRLLELWTDASENVAHLSWRRVPRPGEPVEIVNVALPALSLMASLMLDVVKAFCQELSIADHPNALQFEAALAHGHHLLTE